jgi:hypothetical protein
MSSFRIDNKYIVKTKVIEEVAGSRMNGSISFTVEGGVFSSIQRIFTANGLVLTVIYWYCSAIVLSSS